MPSYFPENNTPLPQDSGEKSLQKINDLLVDGISVVVGELEIKNDSGNPLWVTDGGSSLTVDGTITALEGGETPTSGTATLTNDTRWELNTEGFATIAFEIVSTGVTWGSNGVVAQAYNGTAPGNGDIFAPAGIRYRHANDVSIAPTTALNNIYWNLNIGPTAGNGFGTNLVRVDGSNIGSLALPVTGPRYFLFDLTTARFALRPFFTAGTVAVNYRLYRGRHPYFSARNVIVKGEGSNGAVPITGTVNADGSQVYVDGGYLDNIGSEVSNGINSYAENLGPFPVTGTVAVNGEVLALAWDSANDELRRLQFSENGVGLIVSGSSSTSDLPVVVSSSGSGGVTTVATFTSTTSATLRVPNTFRKLLTVFNEGPGNLHILYGAGTASTTNYSVRLSTGDYLEIDKYTGQVNAIFATAGTARVTEITL